MRREMRRHIERQMRDLEQLPIYREVRDPGHPSANYDTRCDATEDTQPEGPNQLKTA